MADDDEQGWGVVPAVHQGQPRAMVRTQTAYQTAMVVQVPRNMKAVERRVLEEASFARDSFFYSWQVNDRQSATGKSTIEGVSIDGAMILIRSWGNAACEATLDDDTPTHWIFSATFIDLETGFTDRRLFRQRKAERHGKFDDERALDIAFQIGQSKAKRNVIARALPAWLVDQAMEAAHAAAEKRYADVAGSLEKVRPAFLAFGITDEQLQKKIGKQFADWLPRDVVQIRAVYKAIQDGQSSAAQEFSDDEAPPANGERPELAQARNNLAAQAERLKTGGKAATAPAAKTAPAVDAAAPAASSAAPAATDPAAADDATLARHRAAIESAKDRPAFAAAWAAFKADPAYERLKAQLAELYQQKVAALAAPPPDPRIEKWQGEITRAGGDEESVVWDRMNDDFQGEIPAILIRSYEARWPTKPAAASSDEATP